MRSTVRWAVALIAAILLTAIVAVEPSEIRYDLSSARGGFLGAEHADRHLRAAAADATRADPRVYASSLGANPDWIRDGALGVAMHRSGRAREGDAAGGSSDERSGPVPTPAPPSRMKPPRGERGDGDGDGAHRARESAANVGGKRHAMRSLADELARRDPTARRRREGASFAIGTERAIRVDVDPPADARVPGWELTWHDEFDGDRLDLTKWTPRGNSSGPGFDERTPGLGAQQWYDPRECVVSGGALAMRTRRRPDTSPDDFFHEPGTVRTSEAEYPFVSCWVDTLGSFSQTYGRVEVRARFPDQSCPGIRPRHWMLPDPSTGYGEACWPLGGEIDIAGAHGGGRGGPGSSPNAVESGYHFAPGGVCGARSEARGRHRGAKNLNLDGEFHAYAVEWDKSSLRFYVDGVLTNVLDRLTVPIVPRWPFYLILNTEMSPFGMPDAMTECDGDFFHYVDYVRVYKRAEVAVHANVYRFLSLAAIGALVTLSCAACVALRRNLDDDDEWASREEEERIRVKGLTPDMTERYFDHDSEDYYSAVGGARRRGTTAPKKAGREREANRHGEPLRSGSGSSGSDLRLLDAGSTRERRLEGEASVDRRRRSSRRSAEERAPLVGGVGLRVPTDSTPSHSSHGSDGGEYGGNGGGLRWRRAGSTSVFGSRPAFGPPLRASEGSVGSGSSGAGSDDDAASFAPAAVRVSA